MPHVTYSIWLFDIEGQVRFTVHHRVKSETLLFLLTFQAKCSRYRRLLSSEFLRRFLLPSWLRRKTRSIERSAQYSEKHIKTSSEKYLTVPHSLGVFIGEGRRKAAPLALTAARVRRRALGLRVLGLRLD